MNNGREAQSLTEKDREGDSQEELPRINVNPEDCEVWVHTLVCQHSRTIRTEFGADLKIFPNCTHQQSVKPHWHRDLSKQIYTQTYHNQNVWSQRQSKNLESTKRKMTCTIEFNKWTIDFLLEVMGPEGSGIIYSKC